MLKFCPECGAKLPEGFKFCGQCGTKIPTLEVEQEAVPQPKAEDVVPASEPASMPKATRKPTSKATATRKPASNATAIDKPVLAPAPAPAPQHEIKIGKYKLYVDETVIPYNKVRKKFVDYAKRSASAFETYYAANVKDFEGLYEKALPKVTEEAAKAIIFARDTLRESGLPTLTEEDFLLHAQDGIHLDRDFQEYTNAARDIVDFVEQLSSYRAAQRSLPSGQWVGGGFGLKGAIGGALMAGALNLGTQAVRGIGSAVVNSADRARLKKVFIELYNTRDHKEFISKKLYNFCVDLFDPACEILEDAGLLVHPPLDTMTGAGPMNEGFNLVNGKQKVSTANYERAIELALQGMSYDPYWLISYLTLYQVPQIKRKDVKKLAQFFGVEQEFSVRAKELEAETVTKEFDRLPAGTLDEIDAKIVKAEELNKELCYTKVSVTKLQQAKNKIIKKMEDEAEKARKKKEEEEAKAKKLEEDKAKYKELKKLPEKTLQQLEEKREKLQKIEGIPAAKKELERLEKLIEETRWEQYKSQVQEAFQKAFPARLNPKKYATELVENRVFRILGDRLDRDLFRTTELVQTVCETSHGYYDIFTKADLADPKVIHLLEEKRKAFAPYGDAEVPIMCVKEFGDSGMMLTNHRVYIRPDGSDTPISFPLNEIRSFSITEEVVGLLRTKYTYLSVSNTPRFCIPTSFLEKLGKEKFLLPIKFFVNYCLFLAASHETQSGSLYLDALQAAGISQEDFERPATQMSVDEIKTYMEGARLLIREKDYDGIWARVKQGDTCMQYALESHYLNAVIKADPNDSADHENEVAAVIQGIAKGEDKQCLFAQYLEARLWEEYCDRNELDDSPYEEKIFALADAGLFAAKAMKGILMIRDDQDSEDQEQEGVALLREAANVGDPTALAWMGFLYRTGSCGFPVDRDKAEQLLSRGAAYGLSFAAEELKELREEAARQEKQSSSGCFITSAVCRVLGKPDDCYELTAFRGFRDGWLASQPDGKALIQEYYQVAPKIVQQIDSQPSSAEVYQAIWDTYLVLCLHFIEEEELLQCKETYVAMVTELKEKYLQKELI